MSCPHLQASLARMRRLRVVPTIIFSFLPKVCKLREDRGAQQTMSRRLHADTGPVVSAQDGIK